MSYIVHYFFNLKYARLTDVQIAEFKSKTIGPRDGW